MQHKDLIAGNNYTRFLHLLQIIFAFGIIYNYIKPKPKD